jgi:hypothetical protein
MGRRQDPLVVNDRPTAAANTIWRKIELKISLLEIQKKALIL